MNRIRAAGGGRPLAACLLLGLLAACGQTPQRPVTSAPVQNSEWARPNSYDPPGPPGDPWGPYIAQASRRFDIPERWIREVMRQESAGRVSATSPVGAMGLMQVMPGTYRELQARYGLGTDPYHPWDSLMAGTAYLREMYELYGSPGFLAAYNAGPRRLEDYLWGSRGLPNETRNYVARIGSRIGDAAPRRRAAPEVYAAAEMPINIPAGPRRGDTATMLALRDQRRAVDPGIRVAQLPPGPVVRMDPVDGGTSLAAAPTPPPRTQIASAGGFAPAGSVIGMAPITSPGDIPAANRMEPIESPGDRAPAVVAGLAPVAVATMEPVISPGDPGTVRSESLAPLPPAAPMALAALPPAAPRMAEPRGEQPRFLTARAAEPRLAPPPAPFFMSPANAATPPRGPAPAAPTQLAAAPAAPHGFSIIPQAHAGTLPPAMAARGAAAASGGGWAIQVGAFASANLARAAAGQAREQVGSGGTRAQVEPASQGRNTLYRARVQGLSSRGAAEQACDRLRGRSACMIVAPGA